MMFYEASSVCMVQCYESNRLVGPVASITNRWCCCFEFAKDYFAKASCSCCFAKDYFAKVFEFRCTDLRM